VQPRNTCMTLHDRLVHQTRLFHTTSLLGFHRISCNQSLVICIREAARSETLEVKYRKMMEDNNVEKVCLFRSAFTLRLSTSLGLIKKKTGFFTMILISCHRIYKLSAGSVCSVWQSLNSICQCFSRKHPALAGNVSFILQPTSTKRNGAERTDDVWKCATNSGYRVQIFTLNRVLYYRALWY